MNDVQLRDELIARAGIDSRTIDMGRPDDMFNSILDALRDIHRGKEVLYGDYLKTHGSEPDQFFLTQHFCDLKRKYVRADNFIKRYIEDKNSISLDQLLDTYSDLAVYAIMGIQCINHVMERAQNSGFDVYKDRTITPTPPTPPTIDSGIPF